MKRSVFNQMLVDMRSGEFEKAQGYLHTKGYCCLGLVTRRSNLGEFVEAKEDGGHDKNAQAYESGDYSNLYNLPYDVQRWAGCDSERGARIMIYEERLSAELQEKLKHTDFDSETFFLDEINDWHEDNRHKYLTFSEQADLFEAHQEQIVTEEDAE